MTDPIPKRIREALQRHVDWPSAGLALVASDITALVTESIAAKFQEVLQDNCCREPGESWEQYAERLYAAIRSEAFQLQGSDTHDTMEAQPITENNQ